MKILLTLFILLSSNLVIAQIPAEYYEGSTVDKNHRIQQFQFALQDAESEGAYSSNLSELLLGMGRVYNEFEDYDEAITVLKRALHVTRLNDGLMSESQLPVADALFKSYVAAGESLKADELQNYMFRIKRHLYEIGSDEYEKAVYDYVTWQRIAYRYKIGERTFNRLLRVEELYEEMGETDPAFAYKQFYNRYAVSMYAGEPVSEIQISIGGYGGSGAGDLAADHEYAIFTMIKKANYRGGKRILTELLERETDPAAKAKIYAMLGDWKMWYGKPGHTTFYKQAYELDPSLFNYPIKLPPKEARTVDEYETITSVVIFNVQVTKAGKTRDIEELHFETEHDRFKAKKRVKRWKYRPRMVGGELVDTNGVIAKYVTIQK